MEEAKVARSPSFSVDQKTGCQLFWYQKYATLVCQWFLAKIEGIMVIRYRKPLKQKHHAKKIPSWELTYPFAKVRLSRWFSGFSCLVGPMFPRTLEGKTRFLSWNQLFLVPNVPQGWDASAKAAEVRGCWGWWSYPNLRQKWIILCLNIIYGWFYKG